MQSYMLQSGPLKITIVADRPTPPPSKRSAGGTLASRPPTARPTTSPTRRRDRSRVSRAGRPSRLFPTFNLLARGWPEPGPGLGARASRKSRPSQADPVSIARSTTNHLLTKSLLQCQVRRSIGQSAAHHHRHRPASRGDLGGAPDALRVAPVSQRHRAGPTAARGSAQAATGRDDHVSERGYASADRIEFETLGIVTEWTATARGGRSAAEAIGGELSRARHKSQPADFAKARMRNDDLPSIREIRVIRGQSIATSGKNL